MFIWGQFHLRYHSHQSIKLAWKFFFLRFYWSLLGSNELIYEDVMTWKQIGMLSVSLWQRQMTIIASCITGQSSVCSTVCWNEQQRNTRSALMSICEGNPPVTNGFPTQRDKDADNGSIGWCHNVAPSRYGSKCWPDVTWNLNQNIFFIKENGFESVVCDISAISSWWGMGWTWWHHAIETFLALLGLCEGNPPITVGFLSQRPGNVEIW